MVEIKRKVKKTVEEVVQMELKPEWYIRVLRPNSVNTFYVEYIERFDYEPTEQEIASILAEQAKNDNYLVTVNKNYRLVEV